MGGWEGVLLTTVKLITPISTVPLSITSPLLINTQSCITVELSFPVVGWGEGKGVEWGAGRGFYLQQLNSSLQSAQSLCPSHLHFSLIHSPASQWNSPFLWWGGVKGRGWSGGLGGGSTYNS